MQIICVAVFKRSTRSRAHRPCVLFRHQICYDRFQLLEAHVYTMKATNRIINNMTNNPANALFVCACACGANVINYVSVLRRRSTRFFSIQRSWSFFIARCSFFDTSIDSCLSDSMLSVLYEMAAELFSRRIWRYRENFKSRFLRISLYRLPDVDLNSMLPIGRW